MNFVQQLSGVASIANRFALALQSGKNKSHLDTRKTIPGFRTLQNYAVRVGGSIIVWVFFDMVLVKDNHIAACGGVLNALDVVRSHNKTGLRIENQVKNLTDLQRLLNKGVDVIMLDNMDNVTMQKAVQMVRESGDTHVKLENSGNMNLERVAEIADFGIDFISVGALTQCKKHFDISMR